LQFNVLNVLPNDLESNTAYLINDNWDDWFEFSTLYSLYYNDTNNNKTCIGNVKIGQTNMEEAQRRANISENFTSLSEIYFSLGQSVTYYENLNSLEDEIGNEILLGLRDISYNIELFEQIKNLKVTTVSLFREITQNEVKGQFHRIAHGGATLTPYNFTFIAPKPKNTDSYMNLEFNVSPNSIPSTNVHVLIGRNGVGKTHLLNNMLDALFSSEATVKHGIFNSEEKNLFSNVISVSFSAFDESEVKKEQKDKRQGLTYSYIGLKREGKETSPKSPTILKNEFIKSLNNCKLGNRKDRWKNAVKTLESDPMFQESDILRLIDISDEVAFKEESSNIFKKLSSGHKIVLLTITRLVETVEEKTFVMLDEPESHLHPPLLSAFTRALSQLLMIRNGVAIIATHSPVILQEVPKECVWILNRIGIIAKAERPERETFGENVGILTHEVFGLEVTNAGFYNLIKKAISCNDNYEDVKSYFSNQLGSEAKAIVRGLIHLKNSRNS
jgi:ABC-type cobalamin/Fe3+-siderophores transport system ATPase subunit